MKLNRALWYLPSVKLCRWRHNKLRETQMSPQTTKHHWLAVSDLAGSRLSQRWSGTAWQDEREAESDENHCQQSSPDCVTHQNQAAIINMCHRVTNITCVHHRPRHWSYHWHGSLRSATERSPSLLQELGTVCHQKWHHQAVSDHSRPNSRPICFPPLSHKRL